MKILIIRFSSFGDVLQSLSIAGRLKLHFPKAEIHWVTRREFMPLIVTHPAVAHVWGLQPNGGLSGLISLGKELKSQKFTHIYDAHNNLRSRILSAILNGVLGWRRWSGQIKFIRRSIYRWRRFLLFRFHINLFPRPFSGQGALLEPLKAWGVTPIPPPVPQLFLNGVVRFEELRVSPFIALAPSAAFPLKRWPIEYWADLIRLLPETRFVLLGGPNDQFLSTLVEVDPARVTNLAGHLTLEESARVVSLARGLVSNDTGLMHVAEQLGVPCLALMGPAPFGFPSRPLTQIFEIQLPCRPCSKHGQGPCVNPEFQKCLRDIRPTDVAQPLRRIANATLDAPLPVP